MDRKSIVILVAAILLLLGLSPLVDHFFPPKPIPPEVLARMTNTHPAAAQSPVTGSNATAAAMPIPAPYAAPLAAPSAAEQILTVSNQDLIFHFTSYGGGLKTVSLRDYPAVISRTGSVPVGSNMATLNVNAPTPIFAVRGAGVQGDNYFHLTQNGRVVTAEKTLTNGLRLVKTFDVRTNYLFSAQVRFENTSGQPLKIPARELVIGAATPVGPLDDPSTIGSYWYNGVKAQSVQQSWFANHLLNCAVLPSTPRTVYEEGTNNVVWAAVHNQFFTLAAVPSNAAPEIIIRPITIPPPEMVGLTNSTSAMLTNGFEAAFGYPELILAPHQSFERTFTIYAGPKEYKRLSTIGLAMDNNLDLLMDFTGPTGFFSKMLLLSMNGLHALGMGHVEYGWVIIIITILIKGIFWPLTKASTRSQKRLQVLQPQIKAIAEKYKDDAVKKNQKTMDFMKEHKVSPLGSCLPMVIQIPIFFGFYYMLRNAIELRGAHFLWVHDLSQPDTVAYIAGFPINPLPLVMGVTQLWQSHILPPSPGMDPGQQKMMRYMPLLFVAMFYRMSAGLTLYYTVSNLLSILQTKITKASDAPGKAVAAVSPRKT